MEGRMRAAAAVLCLAGCFAAVALLVDPHPKESSSLAVRARQESREAVHSLDRKLHRILDAEKTAAGAIDVLWRETNRMPDAQDRRDGRRTGLGGDNGDSTWSAKMARSLETLDDLELPAAEQIAPSNLDLNLYHQQAGTTQATVEETRVEAIAPSTRAPWETRSTTVSASQLPAPGAASATAIRAAARVAEIMSSVKRQETGTEQLVAKQNPSFFHDALHNLAARQKPLARSHLKARTMMLSAAPEDSEKAEAAGTEMAIQDAVKDEGMGREEEFGDTLKGHWHAPMWPNGDDEGSPVLTSTIAAPGQGGEFAYGFPYDEAKIFAVQQQNMVGNETGGNATDGNCVFKHSLTHKHSHTHTYTRAHAHTHAHTHTHTHLHKKHVYIHKTTALYACIHIKQRAIGS